MNRPIRLQSFAACLAAVLMFSVSAAAQQKTQSAPQQRRSYEVSSEVSLQGTVVSFAENSSAPPLGPHVVVQTASGQVDVHLGDARLLQANHFTLAAGDSVRVIGENVPYGTGTQFFARIIQKGNQTLALRSTRGFPLRPAAKAGKSQAGVL
jgi:ATPase subunit of ABC transporter with duplicated ATPase domains